jgi:hypothetical protein
VTAQPSARSSLVTARPRWSPLRSLLRAGRIPLVGIGIFLVARLVTSAFVLWLTTQTGAGSEAGASPTFAALSSVWDGRWYEQIALHGYPLHLPLDAQGQVRQNAWAFLPAYPYLTQAVALLTGAQWSTAAIAVSVCFGAAAAGLLAVLLTPHVGGRAALLAVALFSCSPVSFMLQMTYADSMMACLTFGALCLLDRRRYLLAIPVVAVASLTRPGVLAFALACVLHLVRNRREAVRSKRTVASAAALLAASCAGGLLWPAVVAVVTGDPHAYFATETAWRALWMGRDGFTVFVPWLFVAQQLFGIAGIAVLGAVLGAGVFFLARPASALGFTVRSWIASYGLYLLAVFMPQTSLPRLLIPMAPALGALPLPTRRIPVAMLLVGSTALQLLWLWCTYGPVKTYLTVP